MKKRIIIIEDDSDYREILTLMLERKGYEVTGVSNGFELARTDIATRPPDLILLDLVLPLMRGEDVINIFQKNDFLRDVVLVVMSSKDESDIIKIAEKLNASAWFQKPFTDEILISKVESLLKKPKATDIK